MGLRIAVLTCQDYEFQKVHIKAWGKAAQKPDPDLELLALNFSRSYLKRSNQIVSKEGKHNTCCFLYKQAIFKLHTKPLTQHTFLKKLNQFFPSDKLLKIPFDEALKRGKNRYFIWVDPWITVIIPVKNAETAQK